VWSADAAVAARSGAGTALVAALALALAPAAGASVVPQRSLAGIEIDMSQRDVKLRLGTPDRVRHVEEFGFGDSRRHRYRARGLTVTIASDRHTVVSVFTRSAADRTRTGVGVGSTEKEMRRGLRGEECGKRGRVVGWCFTGGSSGIHTIFNLRDGRVSSVELRKTVAIL